MKFFLQTVMAVLVLAFPPLALHANAAACYKPAEAEAEQLLRLHSELMVVAITCRQASDGSDLVRGYTDFTKSHIDVLHDAEQTMKSYYRAQGGGDGVSKLDVLRTKLANEYGKKIADVSAPKFCEGYRDVVMKFRNADQSTINDEVHRMEISEKFYVKLCNPPSVAVANYK